MSRSGPGRRHGGPAGGVRCHVTSPQRQAEMKSHIAELAGIRERVLAGPSEKATAAQHAKGKLTARERIELLLDPGSFQEV
ncbi:carboxyl transferase domain-containing protein, partial [Streptomyces sp. NPDC001056]